MVNNRLTPFEKVERDVKLFGVSLCDSLILSQMLSLDKDPKAFGSFILINPTIAKGYVAVYPRDET
jgi:hypothetical protein